MPIIPHFSNECLKLINEEKKLKWPNYDEALLEESFVNIVVQINGKKRGLIKTKKNIEEEKILEIIKKEKNLMKYLINEKIKNKIFIPNKLINIII
jgi:leucyl-tRNA synthetase